MFSTTKFLIAGAIVVLSGSVLTSGVPAPTNDRPTVIATVSGPSEPEVGSIDAVSPQENEFTGKLAIDRGVSTGSPGVIGYAYRVDEMSDPRFDGAWVLAYTQTSVDFGDSTRLLYHASFRMENDEGAWQEDPNLTLEYPDGTASSRTSALVGEGAYDGLIAVAELTYIPQGHFDIHGVVTDMPVPQAPIGLDADQ